MSIADDLLPERSTCGYCKGNCDHDSQSEAVAEWIDRYMSMDEDVFRRRFRAASRCAEASTAMKAAAAKRGIEL